MALPQPVRISLAGGCAVLLGGLGGLTWWWLRRRRLARGITPDERPDRWRRAKIAAVVVLVAITAVGIGWRTEVAAAGVRECAESPAATSRHLSAELVAEKVVTWPETGVAMLYARAFGASLCKYPPSDYYVDFHSGRFAGVRVVTVGDVVLAPPFDTSVHRGDVVAEHEARHRPQWTVATVLGGPFLFPVAYGIDDFFFPGPRNQFERLAGLDTGGYHRVGYGPVIGWPQLVALILAGTLVGHAAYRRVRRRQRARRTERACGSAGR